MLAIGYTVGAANAIRSTETARVHKTYRRSGCALTAYGSSAAAEMQMIGYLSGRSPDAEEPMRAPLLAALDEAGFVAGRNVAIEYRFAEGLRSA